MISQIVDFALFFLVLFFLVPGIMIFIKLMRSYIHQHHHKHARWHKAESGKLAG